MTLLSIIGDDHEAWSQGLTPSIFWKYQTQILSAQRHDLGDLIQDLITKKGSDDPLSGASWQSFMIQQTGLTILLAEGTLNLLQTRRAEEESSLSVLVSVSTHEIHIGSKGIPTDERIEMEGDMSVLRNLGKTLLRVTPVCIKHLRDSGQVRLIAGGLDVSKSLEVVIAIALSILGKSNEPLYHRALESLLTTVCTSKLKHLTIWLNSAPHPRKQ